MIALYLELESMGGEAPRLLSGFGWTYGGDASVRRHSVSNGWRVIKDVNEAKQVVYEASDDVEETCGDG